MKKIKAKIYKVYNELNGDEIIINFKPNKQDLLDIVTNECWGMDNEDRKDSINAGYYTYVKLDVYGK